MKLQARAAAGVVIVASALGIAGFERTTTAQKPMGGVPTFQVDPFWPKFDDKWMFGSIGGLAIDPTNDHVWVLNRPRTLEPDENYAIQNPRAADCCEPPPTVMEFDPNGKFLQGWNPAPEAEYEWPTNEHGLTIDYKGNFWIAGNGKGDAQVLKFTKGMAKFLLQIGHRGKSAGSNDTLNFNRPTHAFVYAKTNEVFIADGYDNRRLIVFDAETGQYKRHWGAFGNKPDDSASRERLYEGPTPQQFNLPHDVLISNDDLLYVADRSNNRIQVFRPDGTFIKEASVAREVRTPTGTVVNLALSPDKTQQFLYVSSGNQKVRILNRQTLQVVGTVGRLGHYAGQFHHITDVAVDSKGNLYAAENEGKRVQKFVFKGMSNTPTQ